MDLDAAGAVVYLVVALDEQRRKRPRRIHVAVPRRLWGADLTIVWLLGIFPVWLVGIVDYHGSRLVVLEPVLWPTTANIVRVLTQAFERDGVHDRLLTDRDPLFRAGAFKVFVAICGVIHTLTKPAHPWTNGGLTPDEVHAGRQVPTRATTRVTYFDGQLRWYQFGA